jgi:hypothetical protein
MSLLTALSSLDLSGCHSLQQLPDTMSLLTALTSLDMTECPARHAQLPDSLRHMAQPAAGAGIIEYVHHGLMRSCGVGGLAVQARVL